MSVQCICIQCNVDATLDISSTGTREDCGRSCDRRPTVKLTLYRRPLVPSVRRVSDGRRSLQRATAAIAGDGRLSG